MKALKMIMTITVCFTLATAWAEEKKEKSEKKDNPPQTLLDASDMSLSGYGGLYYRFSKVGDTNGHFGGIRGGFIINDNFVLGLSGMGLIHPGKREEISGIDYSGTEEYTEFGYGGVLIEYYFMPKNLIVFSAGMTIGGGSLLFHEDEYEDDEKEHHGNGDIFFVVEPELNAFVNITRWCRVGVGASYRYVRGIGSENFSNKDFRGPAGTVMAQFGWF